MQEYEVAQQVYALLRSELQSRERVFQEVRNRYSQEVEEWKRAQEWRTDDFSHQELRESQFFVTELTDQIQELQDREDLLWNHCFSTPRRSETNGIAERAVRRVKEGTSAMLLQSGVDETWWAGSMEGCCYQQNDQDPVVGMEKLLTNGVLENHTVGQQSVVDRW